MEGKIKAARCGAVGRGKNADKSGVLREARLRTTACQFAQLHQRPQLRAPRVRPRHDARRRPPRPHWARTRHGQHPSRQAVHRAGAGGGREGRRRPPSIRTGLPQRRLRPRPRGQPRRHSASDQSDAQRHGQGPHRAAESEGSRTQRSPRLPATGGRDEGRRRRSLVRR